METNLKDRLFKQLIVSCQAVDDEPLNDPYVMQMMAHACLVGGAKFLRVSQVKHIKAIRKTNDVPMIGIIKKHYENSEVFITPTIKEVKSLVKCKVEIIALDATNRLRPTSNLASLVETIRKNYPKQLIMADCSCVDDIKIAENLGFDFIGTTLRGYTKETLNMSNVEEDFKFIKEAAKLVNHAKLIVEGGIWTPEAAKSILEIDGVHAIVVGSAITRPQEIVKKYISAVKTVKGNER